MSRRHLRLAYSASGACWQVLIAGKNAVQVDGASYKRTPLASGAEGPEVRVALASDRCTAVRVGDVRFWFCPAISNKQS